MDDVPFTRGPARRPATIVGDPILQWATGLQTRERRIYAGWLAEKGRHDEFDVAMATAGFATIVIKHGSGNYVEHWAVETANLFVIADGVQSIGEMKHTEERYGIAFGWRTVMETGTRIGRVAGPPAVPRQQSVIRFRAHLYELLELGFRIPIMATAKSTLTGDLITALAKQIEVLDAVDAFRIAEGKKPMQPPFYACAIPIGPGQEVARGNGGQTKEITPPIAKLPEPITKDYIRKQWLRKEWVPAVEDLVDETIRWSVQTSRLIVAGEDQRSQGQPEEDDA